ncbi:retrovirus-related pol polyprotein from transposon TNT 1-94 [Tanacetum coccineum]
MKDKVVPNNSQVKFKKTEVEDHHRISSISNKTKFVTACNDSLKSRTSNVDVVRATYGKCMFNSNHDACVSKFLNDVNCRTKKPKEVPISTREPKSQANKSVATPPKKTVASESTIQKSKSYYRMLYEKTSKAWKWWIEQQCPSGYKWVPKTKMKWVPKVRKEDVNTSISTTIDNASRITNVLKITNTLGSNLSSIPSSSNSLVDCSSHHIHCTVRFGNDQFAPILGYEDLVQRNITINRVYYIEDLQGNDLLTDNHGSDLYTISLQEMTSSTPIYFMAKSSPTQSWLWHQRLSHVNFDYINLLLKKDVMIGLPKLKYVKDQLCSSCEVCKEKRSSFKTKAVPSSKGRLNLLHMDLCGPMRVATINGKKYILVIVDEYSRYTWTLFLRSKDETPESPYTRYSMHTSKKKELSIKLLLLEHLNRTALSKDETASYYDNSGPIPQLQNVSPSADTIAPSQQELDLLFGPLYDEFFTAVDTQVQQDEFINSFCTPVREVTASSSSNIDNSNMHTFDQPHDSKYRQKKDHPLEQVRGNPSKPVQIRRQLATDPKMCMFALTVSTAEPKNIKEAMANFAWIEAVQEELHQFDRLQIWELVDKPFGKTVIKQKWL